MMTTGTLHAPCSTMAQIKVLLQLLSPQTIQKTSNLSEWCPPEFRMDFTVCNPE